MSFDYDLDEILEEAYRKNKIKKQDITSQSQNQTQNQISQQTSQKEDTIINLNIKKSNFQKQNQSLAQFQDNNNQQNQNINKNEYNKKTTDYKLDELLADIYIKNTLDNKIDNIDSVKLENNQTKENIKNNIETDKETINNSKKNKKKLKNIFKLKNHHIQEKISESIKNNNKENDSENENNHQFKVNIDFNNENILFDEALFENEENLRYKNYNKEKIKDFFNKDHKNQKSNKIKDRLKENQYNQKDLKDNQLEVDIKLNKNEIYNFLKTNNKNLTLKLIIFFISFVGSITILFLASDLNFNFYSINLLALADLGLLFLASVAYSNEIIAGFKSLLKLSNPFSSIFSIAWIFQILQSCFYVYNIENLKISNIYIPAMILIMVFDCLGKFIYLKMARLGLKYLSSNERVSSVYYKNLKNIVDPGLNNIIPFISDNPENDLKIYFPNSDPFNENNKLFFILTICISTLLSICYFLFKQSLLLSLNIFLITLILSFPLSKLCLNIKTVSHYSKKLYKNSIFLYKYSIFKKIKNCEQILIDNNALFQASNFKITKIKIFDYSLVNDSIINVTSLLHDSKSVLFDSFFNILKNKSQLLKPVLDISLSQNLGISGIVNNQKLILGSSDYLLDNNIVIPSKFVNFSNSLISDRSLKPIFSAIDGKLTAMFLIKIEPNFEILKLLKQVEKNNLQLSISLKDPFISIDDICYIYEFNKLYISDISSLNSSDDDQTPLGIFFDGKFANFIYSIISLIKINQRFNIIKFLEYIGFFINSAIIATFISLDMLNNLSCSIVILLQLFWFSISFLVSSF